MNTDVARLKDITVLYCEDEASLREVTSGVLQSFTKKQFIAEDGAQGLQYFKENQDEIDLVITDINMPNMTGLEMAKEIKAINSNIPIIVATAFSNSEYLLEAIDLGVDKYVLKPVNIKKLLNIMAQSLLYHELRDLYRDNLTHLPNRNALLKDISQQKTSTVILIDIDKFSIINELYGEENGDFILVEFSNRIQKYFSSDKFKIYRVGADKFAVLAKDESITVDICKTISYKFTEYIDSTGIQLETTDDIIDLNVTVGIAQSQDSHAYEYAQRVIQNARSKFIQVMVYNEDEYEKKDDFKNNIKWIKKLKDGIHSGNFRPYFQPIVDTNTKEVYKYESLIRYIEDDGTEIPPYIFLPIAKKAKLYPIVIKVMLVNVINIVREKQIRVAVNVSFEDIVNKDTYDFIIMTLVSNPEEAKLIDFEILESEEIKNFDLVKDFIKEVKSYGCSVGVDDFGAGYSNFNMLETLDIDFVKIDGSLIKDIVQLPKQELIVETIASFCHKLGIKTVAEFVSCEEVYNSVKKLGIDYIQGYYFGKPVDQSKI